MQKSLTRNDQKVIQKKIWFTVIFILFAMAIFGAIYFFVLRDFSKSPDGFGNVPMIVFGVFGLFFVGVIGYMMSVFINDLKAGVKNCYEGILEDKRLNIKKSSSSQNSIGSRRGGRSSRSSTQRYYYMTVDGEQHKIEYAMYSNIKVGDTIYFEVAPKSKIILSYKILESEAAKVERNTPNLRRKEYPNSKIRQAPLPRKDKESIYAFYRKKLKRRLAIISIVGLPMFGLAYNGLALLALLIFPLPIILLYQSYKAIRLYFNYKKSIEGGRKDVVQTYITDKLFTTITNNGRQSSTYKLITTYQTIVVPEALYSIFNTGDEITVHKASHLPAVMGISLEEEYYPFVS